MTVPLVQVIELLFPCMLHLENHWGEKIITIILWKGLDAFQGRKEDYDNVFQRGVLGTEESPAHWRLYYERNSDGNIALEAIQVCNNILRCILHEIDTFIEEALPAENLTRAQLIAAVTKYKSAMQLLTLHCELMDDEINQFQDLVDDFFATWLDVFGEEGITNYVHMLGSGHISASLKNMNACISIPNKVGRLWIAQFRPLSCKFLREEDMVAVKMAESLTSFLLCG